MQLQTLNLDFNTSLTTFQESCFSCMPNLKHLSVCATRISNLWTTSAALSKLSSLIELRFQNCLCCKNTGPCPISSARRTQDDNWVGYYDNISVQASSRHSLLLNQHYSYSEEILQDASVINDASFTEDSHWPREDFSEDYEGDAPSYYQELSFPDFLSNALHNFDLLNNDVVSCKVFLQEIIFLYRGNVKIYLSMDQQSTL